MVARQHGVLQMSHPLPKTALEDVYEALRRTLAETPYGGALAEPLPWCPIDVFQSGLWQGVGHLKHTIFTRNHCKVTYNLFSFSLDFLKSDL